MRLVFEIRDLKYATPATSSRAGILWISVDEGFQWRCMIQSWLRAHNEPYFTEDVKKWLNECFDKYLPETLRFYSKKVHFHSKILLIIFEYLGD